MNFQTVLNSLGQMDGEYQKKTELIATVAESPEDVKYSQNGVPGQNIVFRDESGMLQKVKWLGQKGKDFQGLAKNTVGISYHLKAWPFYVEKAGKAFIYCWLDSVVSGSTPTTLQNAPQSTKYHPEDDYAQIFERIATALERIANRGQSFEEQYNLNEGSETSQTEETDIPF